MATLLGTLPGTWAEEGEGAGSETEVENGTRHVGHGMARAVKCVCRKATRSLWHSRM